MIHNIKILLIEDDEIESQAFIKVFEKNGFGESIVHAKDGFEAYEMLDKGSIDQPYIIFIDLSMPRMNGFEFLEKIRSNPLTKNAIAFVLTSSDSEKHLFDAYQYNIAGYILKSDFASNPSSIVDMLRSYMQVVQFPTPRDYTERELR